MMPKPRDTRDNFNPNSEANYRPEAFRVELFRQLFLEFYVVVSYHATEVVLLCESGLELLPQHNALQTWTGQRRRRRVDITRNINSTGGQCRTSNSFTIVRSSRRRVGNICDVLRLEVVSRQWHHYPSTHRSRVAKCRTLLMTWRRRRGSGAGGGEIGGVDGYFQWKVRDGISQNIFRNTRTPHKVAERHLNWPKKWFCHPLLLRLLQRNYGSPISFATKVSRRGFVNCHSRSFLGPPWNQRNFGDILVGNVKQRNLGDLWP